jgi:predicted enzyme related to lactoylglutathione lyase
MAIRYVGALVLQADNPKKMADWYRRYFGLDVTLEHEGGFFGAFDTERGPFHFGITPSPGTSELSQPREVLLTLRVDNFTQLLKKLKREHQKVLAVAEDDEGSYAMVHDPEGNQVSIWGD